MKTGMLATRSRSKKQSGMALIATLLLLLLISGLAAGVAYLVMTQQAVSGSDLQANAAFYAAEAGIERMTTDLNNLYMLQQAPTTTQIIAALNEPPVLPNVEWVEYQPVFQSGTTANGSPAGYPSTINDSTSPYKGAMATIIPISLQSSVELKDGTQARLLRRVEVALIPLFQFGIFCDMDCVYHAGDNFDFRGRVHSNGNIFLLSQSGYTLTFHDKITVARNPALDANPMPAGTYQYAVVRDRMPNGDSGPTGTVKIPVLDGGCDPVSPTNAQCRSIGSSEGSVRNGLVPWGGTEQATVFNTTMTTYNQHIQYDVPRLELPFIPKGAKLNDDSVPLPIEIIRRKPATGDTSTTMARSRFHAMATITILLDDDPANLSPQGAADPENVALEGTFQPKPCADSNWWRYGYINLGECGDTANYFYLPVATGTTGGIKGTKKSCTYSGKTYSFLDTTDPVWQLGTVPDPYAVYNFYEGTAYSHVSTALSQTTTQTTTPVPTVGYTPAGYVQPAYVPTTITSGNCGTAGNYKAPTAGADWPLLSGWIRVEVRKTGVTTPQAVTREWLRLGFTRDSRLPDQESGTAHSGANKDYPNAILLLQQWADRSANSTTNSSITGCFNSTGDTTRKASETYSPTAAGEMSLVPMPLMAGTAPFPSSSSCYTNMNNFKTGSTYYYPPYAPYSFYPINIYDAREGEPRTLANTTTDCSLNGVMNLVDLDVGNLRKWLMGLSGTTGTSVDALTANGYILYFSDRRGNEKVGKDGKSKDGGYDYLDTINWAANNGGNGNPNGQIESGGWTGSLPENIYVSSVNPQGNFGNWDDPTTNPGTSMLMKPPKFIGTGFSKPLDSAKQVFTRIACKATAGAAIGNIVMGPRHGLRLVDGSLGYVPTATTTGSGAGIAYTGGFTVASEQPVYIVGNYNATDAGWDTNPADDKDAACAVIADAVTILAHVDKSVSPPRGWIDVNSFISPTNSQGRDAVTSYFRVAIAAGKNRTFKGTSDWGSDGGTHNFLRYLEDWNANSPTVNYKGSLASMWYAAYATGVFKYDGNYNVYRVPAGGRRYSFDEKFKDLSNMPPGTPNFIEIVNTSFRQDVLPTAREHE